MGVSFSIIFISYPPHTHTLSKIFSLFRIKFDGKYVVGLKKFVERQMVDKFLSKNFRRQITSSIESEGVGVG